MSNYVQQTDFSAKDDLPSGDPNKLIRGSDFDAELAAIETAIESKEDSANKGEANGYAELDSNALVPIAQLPVASQGEVAGAASTTKVLTPASIGAINPKNLAQGIYAVSLRPGIMPTANAGGYGWSATKDGTGQMTLTHNFGSTDYRVTFGAVPTGAQPTVSHIYMTKSSNTLTVKTTDSAGTPADLDVDIIIMKT